MGTPIGSRSRWPQSATSRAIIIAVIMALVAGGVALFIAWNLGAFESRLAYWRERSQDCYQVNYGSNGMLANTAAAQEATACFAAAYASCQAAMLTRNAPTGVDTEETDVFVIEPNDHGPGCAVGMSYTFSIVGSGNPTTTGEVQCASVTSAGDKLTVDGCGTFGDVTMP